MPSGIKYITSFPPTEGIKYNEELWHSQHGHAFVIIDCKASNIFYPEHWTPLSIKCAFRGKEFYKLKNTTYAVNDQNFLVLNEGTIYSSYILSDTLTESFTLNFTQRNLQVLSTVEHSSENMLLDDPFTLKNGASTFVQKLYSYSAVLDGLILKLKECCLTHNQDTLRVYELLYLLLKELFRLNDLSSDEADTIRARKKSTREELYKRLNIAKDYLSSCYQDTISLDSVAAACHLNACYLLREFKKFYKITPHQYLTSIRLKEAKRLLENSDKTISQIVHEIGLQDSASFSKLFRKQFGVSPSTFKKSTPTGTN
jgi:AraC-like DNA-binding protein